MYILSVDTTAKTATVCVSKEENGLLLPVCEQTLNGMLTHSETLLPMIERCLTLSQIELSEIGAFAITQGPGSFTGVRIGVSVIKGLAFSQNDKIPCVALSTLLCLAKNIEGYGENALLCPLMDARRNQFYNALFTVNKGKLKRLCEDRVVTAQELSSELCEKYNKRKTVICGDGALLFKKLFYEHAAKSDMQNIPKVVLPSPKDLYQRAYSVALCAWEKINQDGFDPDENSGHSLLPTYLRLSQAERERLEKLQ